MHHFLEALTNPAGDSQVGFFARVIDPDTQATIPLYADNNGTPIASVSGVADMAVTDSLGNLSLYVGTAGTYHLDVYDTNATTFVRRYERLQFGDSGTQLRGDLDATSGSDLVGFLQVGAGAVPRTVQEKQRETVTVTDFGADPAGVSSSQAAFNNAAAAVGTGGCIIVPRGTYKINDVVDILDGQTWRFEGATLTHTDDTKTMLRANGKTGWAIEGNLLLRGLLVSASTSAETGLRITNGKRYRVSGVTATLFKGKGIWLDGATAGVMRGDRGQFTDCATHECTIGLLVEAGAGAEYNTWTNFCASGNITSVQIGAGNNTFLGGNIVDNQKGITLVAGSNHGHGMFVGTNVNHNVDYNLEATDVTAGYTFVGCHFYGNNVASAQGIVRLIGCKGFTVQGGIIDCYIANNNGTAGGLNKILDNYFPGDYGVALFSDDAGLNNLYLRGNTTPTGLSDLNDPSPVNVYATRQTSTQALTSGVATTLIFNSEVKDKGLCYDNATGIFTAQVAGFYTLDVGVAIGAAAALVNSYAQFFKNGSVDVGYMPIFAVDASTGVGCGSWRGFLAAGNTLKVVAYVTGTTPVLVNGEKSWLSINLEGA